MKTLLKRSSRPFRSKSDCCSSVWSRCLLLLPCLWLLVSVLGGTPALAQVLTEDTVWSGDIRLLEDVVVPRGVVLTILPGSRIRVSPAESTKTDPEYISPLTELTIRGVLRVDGSEAAPVVFSGEPGHGSGSWAGVLVDGGEVSIRFGSLSDAESAIQVFSGDVQLDHAVLKGNRYGVVAQGKGSRIRMNASVIRENDYGQSAFGGAEIIATDSTVVANMKRDRTVWTAPVLEAVNPYTSGAGQQLTRVYKDEVVKGETVWRGRIEVNGQVRVPEGARLLIMPGTVVEFRRRDTNGDGIGESGLLIQGMIVAKGTKEAPIFFRSAEKKPVMGDWDSINLMNSDGAQNLIEYCQIEDAYRGVHFHFSNVMVHRSVFRNSYRGIQFQESQVELRSNRFFGNKSAVQGRDSEIVFVGNLVQENLRGVNFFRAGITASDNRFSGNTLDGLRVRDSGASIEKNIFDANRYGLMAQDAIYGRYSSNIVSGNAELGFSLKNLDNLEVHGNYFTGNGTNGMSLQDVRALIRGNAFTDNRERGIGIVSFDGIITENNFSANGLFAIDLESPRNIAAPGNWWGGELPEKVIYDGADSAGRGRVDAGEYRNKAMPFTWPAHEIPANLLWRGDIVVTDSLTVPSGVTLALAPGTAILMGADVSVTVRGKLLAKGEKGKRISFTAIETPKPGYWSEILLERATDSVVEYCDFRGATWGLHSHFTNLVVTESVFEHNFGGIRFRSGPVTISRSLFKNNDIGIRSYRGIAQIGDNEITGNEVGIFVREKGGGLDIRNNDLSGNAGYGVRIGDFNDEDVKASHNWWGDGDPAAFIFDARREEGIGFVRYEPALTVKPRAGIGE